MRTCIAGLVSLILGFIFVCSAHADMFYFNDSNAFGEWQGDVPPGYGSVQITETEAGLDFIVSANTAYFLSTTDPDLTWDAFLFNIDGSVNIDISDIGIEEAGKWSIKYDSERSEYGTFEFNLNGNAIGNNDVNPLEFSINIAGLTIADVAVTNSEGWMFAGHLKRFDAIDGTASTWLGVGEAPAPVPEPSTVFLFGACLVSFVGSRIRKMMK